MVTLITATVITVVFVAAAMWVGSLMDESDYDPDHNLPWQDDSFN